MNNKTITLLGIELEIWYEFTEGLRSGDRDAPDDPYELKLFNVFHKNVEIIDLISSRAEELIKEKLCLN
jgi:hypothetical protein